MDLKRNILADQHTWSDLSMAGGPDACSCPLRWESCSRNSKHTAWRGQLRIILKELTLTFSDNTDILNFLTFLISVLRERKFLLSFRTVVLCLNPEECAQYSCSDRTPCKSSSLVSICRRSQGKKPHRSHSKNQGFESQTVLD